MLSVTTIAIIVLVIFFLSAALKILNEYERAVIFRLGRVIAAKGPGLMNPYPRIPAGLCFVNGEVKRRTIGAITGEMGGGCSGGGDRIVLDEITA